MRGAQRVIKYFALALAAVLILAIISVMIGVVSLLGTIVWGERIAWDGSTNRPTWGVDYDDEAIVKNLDINVKATSVKIRTVTEGEPVKVETNNEYITTWVGENTLNIVEKSHGFFGWGGEGELVINVRQDVIFDQVKLVAGAGVLNIEKMTAKDLELDLGAGKTFVDNLIVSTRARIKGGAGMIEIKKAELNNLDIDLGAGKAALKAKLKGSNKIESGVGKTELTLLGEEKDYKFTIDKGIGSVTLNGVSLGDGALVGSGEARVDIDSGVGAVEIKTVTE